MLKLEVSKAYRSGVNWKIVIVGKTLEGLFLGQQTEGLDPSVFNQTIYKYHENGKSDGLSPYTSDLKDEWKEPILPDIRYFGLYPGREMWDLLPSRKEDGHKTREGAVKASSNIRGLQAIIVRIDINDPELVWSKY